jgi:hypothetical protein
MSSFDKWLEKEYLKELEKEYLQQGENIFMDDKPVPPAEMIIYFKRDFLKKKRKTLLLEYPLKTQRVTKRKPRMLKVSHKKADNEIRQCLLLFKEHFPSYLPSPEFLANDFSRIDDRHLKSIIGREMRKVLKEREETNMIKPRPILIPQGWLSKGKGIGKDAPSNPLDGGRKEVTIHIFKGGYFDIENESILSNIEPSSKTIYGIELDKKATLWEEQIKVKLSPKSLRYIKWTIQDFKDVQNYLKKRSLNKRGEAHSCPIRRPFLNSEIVAIIGTGGTYYDIDSEWWNEKGRGATHLGNVTVKVNSKTLNWIKETMDHFHNVQEYLGQVLD